MAESDAAREPWLGGFVRLDENGDPIYVIRKRVDGKRYEVSTRCNTERAALKQLERFEVDPANYSPGGDEKSKPLYLDADLAKGFLTYCRDMKKNTPLWLGKQKRYVSWWAGKLEGLSLTRITLGGHIKPALVGATATAHRISTIKAIYSWLRKEDRITPAQDPTFAKLSVPQSDPNARAISDKSISKEAFYAARDQLDGHWRAAIEVQAGTGWHLSEVKRFAEGGKIEPHPMKAKGVAAVLVCPEAKIGGLLRTPVGKAVMEAATILLERGSFSIEKYGLAIKGACEAVNAKAIEKAEKTSTEPKLIEVFTPGRLRHSVATWAINDGQDPATVSAFMNHKNPRTTRKFYATHAVVTKITTVM